MLPQGAPVAGLLCFRQVVDKAATEVSGWNPACVFLAEPPVAPGADEVINRIGDELRYPEEEVVEKRPWAVESPGDLQACARFSV